MLKPNTLRLSTGNEMVSIPEINTARCGIETISFLHRGLRAAVEICGSDSLPFLQPTLTIDGAEPDWDEAVWRQVENWVPSFELSFSECEARGHIFAPLESRGFVCVIEIESKASHDLPVRAGWRGCWERTCHATYTAKEMVGQRRLGINQMLGATCVEFCSVAPHFAVAFCGSEVMEAEVFTDSGDGPKAETVESGVVASQGTAAGYSLMRGFTLKPGERVTLAVYVGLGLEEISAVTSAADLARRGHEDLLQTTLDWLSRRALRADDKRLEGVMNLNLFYNYFFALGVTLDTEELVAVTARSSRSPLTAAYCDRDALSWSLPAVLRVDPQQARNILEYAFTVQIKNVGIHSRFIDGVVLEPGFELDELCAPVHALRKYVQATNDVSMLFDRRVQAGINHIMGILALKKHPEVSLYETTLLPSDDIAKYPYVTYNNAMVWRMLRDLVEVYDRVGDLDRRDAMAEQANRVKQAIMEHSVVEGPFGEMFAWSTDLKGNHRLLDNPRGSLQLMPYLDFCSPELHQYKNTVTWIRAERERPEAIQAQGGRARVSLFSLANDLLTDRAEEALDFLRRAALDFGICCEVVDAETGEAISGRGHAACAGFVAHAMATALGATPSEPEARGKVAKPHFRLGKPTSA